MTALHVIKKNGLFGAIDQAGREVLEPRWDFLGTPSEGLICFSRNGRYGFINSEGELVIEARFDSDRIGGPLFSGGLAIVGTSGALNYIDLAGNTIQPNGFEFATDFRKGLAIVKYSKVSAFSVVTAEFNVIGRLNVKEVPFLPNWPKDWNCFPCFVSSGPDLLVAFFNANGNIVFQPRYPLMTAFYESVAGYSEDEYGPSNAYGLITLCGTIIKTPQYFAMSDFEEGVARAGRTPSEFGYIGKRGEWLIEPKFSTALPFREGLACVSLKGRKGFIDCRGDLVIEPKFERQSSFHNGFAEVEYEGRHAVINKTGRVIWESSQGTA